VVNTPINLREPGRSLDLQSICIGLFQERSSGE
jgi:hypothetical protein